MVDLRVLRRFCWCCDETRRCRRCPIVMLTGAVGCLFVSKWDLHGALSHVFRPDVVVFTRPSFFFFHMTKVFSVSVPLEADLTDTPV